MLASEAQRRDVVDKISVTEAEAQAYYEAHKQEFTTPSEITLREIFIEVPVTDRGVNVAEDDAAKAEAEADSTSDCWPASRLRSSPPSSPTRRRRPTAD